LRIRILLCLMQKKFNAVCAKIRFVKVIVSIQWSCHSYCECMWRLRPKGVWKWEIIFAKNRKWYHSSYRFAKTICTYFIIVFPFFWFYKYFIFIADRKGYLTSYNRSWLKKVFEGMVNQTCYTICKTKHSFYFVVLDFLMGPPLIILKTIWFCSPWKELSDGVYGYGIWINLSKWIISNGL